MVITKELLSGKIGELIDRQAREERIRDAAAAQVLQIEGAIAGFKALILTLDKPEPESKPECPSTDSTPPT